MNKEEMLFEFKPCHQCPHTCVEGQQGVKCPFDKMVEDLVKQTIKKGNLNYDQSGRGYPDNPQIKENWDCIWEKYGKHYKLVGDNEHKEWEEIEKQ